MSNNDLGIVILAAGKGTRLKSSLAKVLHCAGGRTLVEQIVRSCPPLKARGTGVVGGHQAEQVAGGGGPPPAASVVQRPPKGTRPPKPNRTAPPSAAKTLRGAPRRA